MAYNVKYFRVEETDSTNLEVLRRFSALDEEERQRYECFVASADFQTAGRGQRGSRWESERGKNLVFSLLLHPKGVGAARQFCLSQAMSVAVCCALNRYRNGFVVKWPNDIYYGERKISGTIIETTLRGGLVDRCVLGVGINVNQRKFCGDAPNPVSLCKITRSDVEPEELLHDVTGSFCKMLHLIYNKQEDEVAARYLDMLIWKEGMHRYRDSQEEFLAQLEGIEPNGRLVLRDENGAERRYMFKEVKHVFDSIECV